jgi:hypothetical protein
MNVKTPRSTYRDNYTARSMATSRMSTSRREKLESMRMSNTSTTGNNTRQAKREKLRSVLKEKLINKYGTVWKSMVIREVDAFITSTMKRRIHENDLAGLENTIRRKTQNTQPESARGTARGTARLTARTARPETNRSKGTGRQTEAQKLAGALDDWTLLDAFDALNNEQDVKAKKSNKRTEGLRLKAELDKQVAYRKAIEKKEKAEEVKYYSGILDEVKDFHQQEKDKAAARQKVVMKMAEERQRQIQSEKRRKEAAKKKQLQYEIDMLDTFAAEIQRDEKKKKRAKRLHMKHAAVVQKQNAKLLEERQQQLVRDAEDDRRLQRENAARSEKKEADRAAWFAMNAAKQAKRAQQNAESRTDEFAKVRDMELRLLREQELRDKKAADNEKAQKQKRLGDLKERNRVLKQQVDAKRKARDDQRDKDALFVQTFKADADAFAKEEKLKKLDAHKKKKGYRKMLADQQSQGRETVMMMTDHERQLNKEKLSKIKNNPDLLQRLHDRVMKGGGSGKKASNQLDDEDEDE